MASNACASPLAASFNRAMTSACDASRPVVILDRSVRVDRRAMTRRGRRPVGVDGTLTQYFQTTTRTRARTRATRPSDRARESTRRYRTRS